MSVKAERVSSETVFLLHQLYLVNDALLMSASWWKCIKVLENNGEHNIILSLRLTIQDEKKKKKTTLIWAW